MTNLERSRDLYAAVVLESKPTDAAVMQLRSWIISTFQQAGQSAVNEVDQARRAGTLIQPLPLKKSGDKPAMVSEPAYAKGYAPKEGRERTQVKYQKFQHPATLGKSPAGQVLRGINRLGNAAQQAADPSEQLQPQTPLLISKEKTTKSDKPSHKNPVAHKESKPIGNDEIAEMLNLQPTAIVQKWSAAQLRGHLKTLNIEAPAGASPRQLAATILGHYKKSR